MYKQQYCSDLECDRPLPMDHPYNFYQCECGKFTTLRRPKDWQDMTPEEQTQWRNIHEGTDPSSKGT